MTDIDVTKRFRTYRDATRLIWNVFLAGAIDQEMDFPDVDKALFLAIMWPGITWNLEHVEGERKWESYYSNLTVKPENRHGLLVRQVADANEFYEADLPERATLYYSDLFDFDWVTGKSRDFEFIRCWAIEGGSQETGQPALVKARSSTVVLHVADKDD
jgi:hypothetical protein